MVAVGLFGLDAGPPVNMHGIEEGCPINDMRLATTVLYKAVVGGIEKPPSQKRDARKMEMYSKSSSHMLKLLVADSDCGCNC